MIAFGNKVDMMDFFKFVLKRLEKDLGESAFEVNLSIMPVDKSNLQVVYDSFQAYQKSKKNVIQSSYTPGLDINT